MQYPSKLTDRDLRYAADVAASKILDSAPKLRDVVTKLVYQEQQRRRRNRGEQDGPIQGPQRSVLRCAYWDDAELQAANKALLPWIVTSDSKPEREFLAAIFIEIDYEWSTRLQRILDEANQLLQAEHSKRSQ
jgi:hypothetical protein